ncbi:hypothetical protein HD806DRAFT_85811 [Xylariaceae sp. AK1471]|nr:hypothetical protein HD806DRAFT_85811 [Xylariaceae sp. AK1471]
MNVSEIQPGSSPGGTMTGSLSDENRITPASVIAIGAVFAFLPAVAVVLRFYCRLRVKRTVLGIDDWLSLAAFVLTLGMGIMLIVGGSIHALAQPSPQGIAPGDYFYVTDDAEVKTEKIFWSLVIVQDLAFGLAKLSVLYLYRRIFVTPLFNLLSMTLIILIGIWTIGFFFAYVFSCGTRFWANWAPLAIFLENCFDTTPYFYALAISDVLTDGLILALPYYWIWRLNMSMAKRFAVLGVFLLGAIEIATGVIRLVIFINKTTNYESDPNGVSHLTTLIIWSMIEISIAVIAGCLPTIWPLASKVSVLFQSVLSVTSPRTLTRLFSTERKSRSKKTPRDLSEDEEALRLG